MNLLGNTSNHFISIRNKIFQHKPVSNKATSVLRFRIAKTSTSELAQGARVLVVKPDDLGSITRTHGRGRKLIPETCLPTSILVS